MRGSSSLAALAAVAVTAAGAIVPVKPERASKEANAANPLDGLSDFLVPPWLASIEESYVVRWTCEVLR